MNLLITPSTISGSVTIPPSKSLTHRYFILAALASGISTINNPLFSDDTLYTLSALQNLGVKIIKKKDAVTIYGTNGHFHPKKDTIYLGDSGTSARLFIGLATLCDKPIVIDGSARLRERPNKELFEALENQGIKIEYLDKKYHLPVKIYGNRLKGGTIKIPGNISSQFISSLLIISPYSLKDVEIEIMDDLKSKPYVDLTIQAMNDFGVKVINVNYKKFIIKANQNYRNKNIIVEGDYSSASYFFALSHLLKKPIQIKNLNLKSRQSDKAIVEMIQKFDNKNIVLDISDCPDIALTLGVMGPYASQSLTLKGTNRLIDKECDRKKALISNLKQLGAKIIEDNNYVKIYNSSLKSGTINTYNDHRVAMSFAILGTMIKDGVIIKNAEVVNKSYPNYFEDLKKIGVNVQKI